METRHVSIESEIRSTKGNSKKEPKICLSDYNTETTILGTIEAKTK